MKKEHKSWSDILYQRPGGDGDDKKGGEDDDPPDPT